MAVLPFPPGALNKNVELIYETIQICPSPPRLIGIGGDELPYEVCCLLLQELRGARMSWQDEEGSQYMRKHPYEPPFETRVVPGFLQTDDGYIWDDLSMTVSFQKGIHK